MKFQIVDYNKSYDNKLVNLFYEYVFCDREEFEYTRPNSWFYRYKPYNSPIIKIAINKKEIIATIGILPTKSMINGKIVDGGYFVDNCVLPKYFDHYIEIMYKLFESAIEESKKRNYQFIAGWDYLKKFEQYQELYSKLGFISKLGINWLAGGFEYKRNNPKKWRGKRRLYWKTLFFLLKFYNRYKKLVLPKKIDKASLKLAEKKDLSEIASFLNDNNPASNFHSFYSLEILKDLWNSQGLRCLIAKKNNEIIAAVTFIISTWTGLMYGKPSDNEWEEFLTIIPDEFVISEEWRNTDLSFVMIHFLLDLDNKFDINSGSSGFVTPLFDRNIKLEHMSFKKWGFVEAKVDFGVYLAKPLNGLEFNTDCAWSIPPRAIVVPYPNWVNK